MSENLGHKALKGTLWASLDRFGVMGLQFIVNIFLARLLSPADFGVIGVLTIFLLVSQTLIDSGFGSALIQKKDTSQLDYSTIFFWNLSLSIGLYLILYLCAPLISNFFHLPILVDVLRVIGILLVFKALSIVQINRLQKRLAFKSISITNNVAQALAGIFAIWAAYAGWGVWSLVILYAGKELLVAVVVWYISHWHPSFAFSWKTFRNLFSFGGFMLMASVLQEACKNFQSIIIGHWFSASSMGYYTQAQKLDQVTSYSLSQVIVQVMFPVYSSMQDDKERLCRTIAMNIRVISLIVFPLLTALIIAAPEIITLLFGDKWLPAAPYFRILSVGGLFVCLQNVNFYAVASKGASRQLFLWSFYKWGMLLALLFVGMHFGMNGIMWGISISAFNIYMVNALLAARHVQFSIKEQIAAFGPVLMACVDAAVLAYAIFMLTSIPLLATAGIFFIFYVVIVKICNIEAAADLGILIKKLLNKTSPKKQ